MNRGNNKPKPKLNRSVQAINVENEIQFKEENKMYSKIYF